MFNRSDSGLVKRKINILLLYVTSKKYYDYVPYLSLLLDDDTSSSEYFDLLYELGVSHED